MNTLNIKVSLEELLKNEGIVIVNEPLSGNQIWISYNVLTNSSYLVFAEDKQHAEESILMLLGYTHKLKDVAIVYLRNTFMLGTI